MPSPTLELTPEQIAFFHRESYLSIPALTTPAELATLRTAYDRIFAEKAGRERGDQFDLAGTDQEGKEASLPQILNPDNYAPEFKNTLLQANAAAIARQLLGPGAQPNNGHAILKPARHGATTPWHQDESYGNPALEHHSLSIWIPLQDATTENGCLHFVPGTHRLEVLPHHPINNDPRVHGLELDMTPQVLDLIKKSVACPLAAGGCTIHSSRTFHYAGPNRTDEARRAYIIGFFLPSKPLAVPRRFPWLEQRQTARLERAKQSTPALAGSGEGKKP